MTRHNHLSPTKHSRATTLYHDIKLCTLEVVCGVDMGASVHPLSEFTVVGRKPSCDLILSDTKASGMRCALRTTEDRVTLTDLGRTNGTSCQGVRIVEAFLEPDSVFQVGDTLIKLKVHDGSQPVARMPCDPTGRLIGSAPAMQEIFALMVRLAQPTIPVVILGETGTGKTLLAEALHQLGPRKDDPFVTVNCATLQPELVESILFGHQKGAFTSAFKQHRGVFEQAHNGTLLLDEIGELPVAVQPKLLQAIETGRVRPVGADKEISVDVRLLTATNRSLAREVSAGRFRQDLYYRLAGLELVLPPLRERLEDLPDLAQHIFHQLTHKHYEECRERFAARTISRAAQAKLSSHPWPGNVRELHHTLGRALILARGPAVEPEDISFPGWIEAAPEARSPEPPVLVQIPELDATFKEFKSALIERHERAYIERLMRRANGNQVQAAKMAGLARSYLKKLLAKYGLRDQKPTP